MNDAEKKTWPPLTKEEKEFIVFWEKERDHRKKWTYLLFHNLQIGILFGVPIALFFMLEAPRHRSLITHTDLVLIMVCIVLIVCFYAIFRGYSKWDDFNSHYQILKMKENSTSSAHLSSVDENK